MSESDHALQLLAHSERLVSHYATENAQLRAEVKEWQTRALALIDRIVVQPSAPPAATPESLPAAEAPAADVSWRKCARCPKSFPRRAGQSKKLCDACRRATKQHNMKQAKEARARKYADGQAALAASKANGAAHVNPFPGDP